MEFPEDVMLPLHVSPRAWPTTLLVLSSRVIFPRNPSLSLLSRLLSLAGTHVIIPRSLCPYLHIKLF